MNRYSRILVVILGLGAVALTQATASANTVIADNMKQIAALVKTITGTVSTPADNAQNAADAAQLVTLFQNVLNVVPDAIVALPAAQQAAATADYKSLVQDEINDATKLQNDFQTGNNSDAAAVLQDMNTIKTEGHTKYNPSN